MSIYVYSICFIHISYATMECRGWTLNPWPPGLHWATLSLSLKDLDWEEIHSLVLFFWWSPLGNTHTHTHTHTLSLSLSLPLSQRFTLRRNPLSTTILLDFRVVPIMSNMGSIRALQNVYWNSGVGCVCVSVCVLCVEAITRQPSEDICAFKDQCTHFCQMDWIC